MRVKIFTMTHKHFQKPEMDIYVPLHVGRALSKDLGYPGDDTGENISALNPYYGELTGLFWIWKNETDADIIGICHYRRYFMNDSGSFMNAQEYERLLSVCDVIVSQMISNGFSNWENYAKMHNAADMEAVGRAVKKLYPQDYPAFCDVLNQTKCCFGNLMVTAAEKYREYCAWLFSVLEEASKNIDVSGYDNYHKRVYGFLSEVLLYVWATARNYRICENRAGVTAEKAETAEFKQKIGQLIADADAEGAKEFFYEYMKQRPDIRLQTSDIRGEIPKIEKLLYIMHQEQKKKEPGLLDFSRDLTVLLEHYKNTYELLQKYGSRAKEAGRAYFSAFPISDTACWIIEQDVKGRLSLYDYLNEKSRKKKVTVVVPVCKITDTFAGCIGNLVHQTLEDIEILFFAEQWEDSAYQLIRECESQYPEKVRIIQTDHLHALQQEAGGEYLLFVRSADLPDTSICEKLYQKAKETGWKLTGGRYIDRRSGCVKQMLAEEPAGRQQETEQFSAEENSMPWGVLIHRVVWEQSEVHARLFDGSFMKKLRRAADSSGNIEDIVYGYSG